MPTYADLARRTAILLDGGLYADLNQLDGAIDSVTGGPINLRWPVASMTRGTTLEVDNELLYAVDVAPGDETRTITDALRGHSNTSAAAHDNRAEVVIDPRHPRSVLFDLLADEVEALDGRGLHGYHTVELAVSGADVYTIPVADGHSLLSIYQVIAADGDTDRVVWRHRPGTDMAYISTLLEENVSITYTHRLTRPTSLDDDAEADSGVPAAAHRALIYGAGATRLLHGEGQRVASDVQPAGRAADQVQEGAKTFLAERWRQLADRAIGQAIADQQKTFPPTRRP